MLISARTGAVNRSFPDVDQGGVSVVLSDGQGGWFVGGGFGCIGGVARPSLVHLRSDGRLDSSWQGTLPADPDSGTGFSPVSALARVGSTLFVGGVFGVAAYDVATGLRRWVTSVVPQEQGANTVVSLAANTSSVYVAGYFAQVAGTVTQSLVALDPQNGNLLSWQPQFPNGYSVWSLALAGTRLYVGGSLPSPYSYLAALDANNGTVAPWLPASTGDNVETILVAGGDVFTAGQDGFGVADSRSGRSPGWAKRLGPNARHFAVSGNTVYLAGDDRSTFSKIAGLRRNNLAAVNLATHRLTNWAPKVNRYVGVSTFAASGSEVLLGGDFTNSLG